MPSVMQEEKTMSQVKALDLAGGPGRLANHRGVQAKHEVESLLRSSGYQVVRRVPIGESIYRTRLVADLLIENSPRWPDGLIVEVVSQASHGSADQKFPYLVANIKSRYPCPTIIVLIGRGFSDGAVNWLRDQVDGQKLLAVTSLDQFESWVSRPLAG
jgi:hypothetical protein